MANGDKRSVSTDALETLGSIIGPNEGRDAIHLAVEPAVAAHTLRPGEDVGFVDGGVGVCDNPVGIVDPFLKQSVKRGERFWLVVYPRQITSLRHVWSHPKFPEAGTPAPKAAQDPKAESEKWLRDFADRSSFSYAMILEGAEDWLNHEEYLTEHDSERTRDMAYEEGMMEQFWHHYEIVTGKAVEKEKRESFFSCSC